MDICLAAPGRWPQPKNQHAVIPQCAIAHWGRCVSIEPWGALRPENLEVPGPVLRTVPDEDYAARILLRNASISARSPSASWRSEADALKTAEAASPASAEAVETPTMFDETSLVPP